MSSQSRSNHDHPPHVVAFGYPVEYLGEIQTLDERCPMNDEQAFPSGEEDFPGISVRDYFAAKALQGALANPRSDRSASARKQFASDSYAMADAMLAERSKVPQ